MLTPSLGSQYPDMLYYVVGAQEYHTHDSSQGKPQPSFDSVGVKALDNFTLEVTLNNPTPFFLGLLSHYSTWPVHKETVLKHGSIDDRNGQWTRPGNFVCNGAFQLKSWELNSRIIVEKNPMYWDANMVGLNEIHYYPVQNVMTEDRMFRAGQLHVTSTLPSQKCPVYIEEKNPDLRMRNSAFCAQSTAKAVFGISELHCVTRKNIFLFTQCMAKSDNQAGRAVNPGRLLGTSIWTGRQLRTPAPADSQLGASARNADSASQLGPLKTPPSQCHISYC